MQGIQHRFRRNLAHHPCLRGEHDRGCRKWLEPVFLLFRTSHRPKPLTGGCVFTHERVLTSYTGLSYTSCKARPYSCQSGILTGCALACWLSDGDGRIIAQQVGALWYSVTVCKVDTTTMQYISSKVSILRIIQTLALISPEAGISFAVVPSFQTRRPRYKHVASPVPVLCAGLRNRPPGSCIR